MQFLVTGAAGFIGSTLVDRLLALGHDVLGFDNFSTGIETFLENARPNPRFELIEDDLLTTTNLVAAMRGTDFVFHLAANADVRFGTRAPRRDLEQNTIVTFNVLEAMREAGVRRIGFSSTGSIYGEAETFPTPESAPFPVQTSLYGASKLGAEGFISAYCEGFDFQAYIFRFVSILGERYTHGHVFDFVRSLLQAPEKLTVLGNGKQRKSYLYVQDCVDAMLLVIEQVKDRVSIFNLGTDDYCEVLDSVGWISERLGVSPKISLTGGERGWIGDNPFIFLDTSKIRQLGWTPKLTIRQGVENTVDYLLDNRWLFEART